MLNTSGVRWRRAIAAARIRKGICLLTTVLLSSLWVPDTPAIERQRVTDIKPLLLAALNRGEAHGVLVGEAAQWTAEHFKTTAPIEIDVKTLQALSHRGCMRLAITTTQDGVWDFNRKERASAAERKAFTWTVNYCRDGNLPNEGAK